MIKKKYILVTGCNGFLGKQLILELLKKDFKVIGFDLHEKSEIDSIKYYKIDITKKINLNNLDNSIDYLIHLAAITNIKIDKKIIYNVNVEGTRNICEFARKISIKKIIYLSTVSVYSSFNEKYINEKTEVEPVNYYGETKLEAENIIKNSGLNFSIFRPTNIFGEEREDYKKYFLRIKERGKKFNIVFYRNRITHLIYIGDVIEAIIDSITNINLNNKIYILADNEEKYSEKNLFEILNKIFDLNKKFFPYLLFWRKYDKRIFKSLNYNNIKYGVEEGIKLIFKVCP